MDTDALLTLDQARTALIGERAASRTDAWPSVKTLRRAYTAGRLAVIQPVPGGRVMVWRSEIMRWAREPRAVLVPTETRVPEPPNAPVPPKPSKARQRPGTATKAKAPTALAARRERKGVPERLSLAELQAA